MNDAAARPVATPVPASRMLQLAGGLLAALATLGPVALSFHGVRERRRA